VFRRFREAVLQRSEARQILIGYWMEHSNPSDGDRYREQLSADVEYRQEQVKIAGLGFDLRQTVTRATWAAKFRQYTQQGSCLSATINRGLSQLGRVAQLGEHLLCKQGVTGSIPVTSTKFFTGIFREAL
jgi:hypothetical protein